MDGYLRNQNYKQIQMAMFHLDKKIIVLLIFTLFFSCVEKNKENINRYKVFSKNIIGLT